jgi:hypothetical protein
MSPFWNHSDEGHGHGRPAPDDGNDADRVESSPADVMLADRVAEALRRDRQVRGRRVEIVVQNRVIILIGDVDTAEASEAAGRCAWGVPGVFDVCNRLGVAGHGGPIVWDWPR